jgi:hypothetical protein
MRQERSSAQSPVRGRIGTRCIAEFDEAQRSGDHALTDLNAGVPWRWVTGMGSDARHHKQ